MNGISLRGFLVAIALLAGWFFAFPALATGCGDLLSINRNIAHKNEVAKAKLEQVIEAELMRLGFSAGGHGQSSFLTRYKMRVLAAQLDAHYLSDENYRRVWIEKLIDLKISEKLNPIEDYNLSLRESDRKALVRLILRSVAQKGVASVESDTNPTVFKKFRKKLRAIRYKPIVRAIAELRLTFESVTLSEDQISNVLRHGESALAADAGIYQAIGAERSTSFLNRMNKIAIGVVGTFLLVNHLSSIHPEFVEQFNVAYAEQMEVKANEVKANVGHLAAINATQALESLALSEKQVILDDFKRRWGDMPTEKERAEINHRICEIKFGDILPPDAVNRCKAL